MNEPLISVENVSKKFCRSLKRSLWYGLRDVAAELTGRNQRRREQLRRNEFWAVDQVAFELRRGECLGLIGRNGAGKSTLLKMLNGLLKPDHGEIRIRGRVGALIELGAGFNPILSARENIYINGAVLGFAKREIQQKFEAIVEFAEIGEFIDTPVQNYSSGMKMRLGFAVASQLEPDVLLVDEVLAVGDVGFKVKCYNEIFRMMERSAVIFVSHSMPQIGRVCTSAMLLDKGRVTAFDQDIGQVVEAYNSQFQQGRKNLIGDGRVRLLNFSLASREKKADYQVVAPDQAEADTPLTVEEQAPFEIAMRLEIDPSIGEFHVALSFADMDQRFVAQTTSKTQAAPFANPAPHEFAVKARISQLNFSPGRYSLSLSVSQANSRQAKETILMSYRNVACFLVFGAHHSSAPIQYRAEWSEPEPSN